VTDNYGKEAMNDNPNPICSGAYSIFLQQWLAVFEPEQFLLLSFNEYLHSPGQTMAAIGDHIGLADASQQQHILDTVLVPFAGNARASHMDMAPTGFNDVMSAETHRVLQDFFAPYNAELDELLHNNDRAQGAEAALLSAIQLYYDQRPQSTISATFQHV
jgi:hypothetical protein